MGLLWTLAPSVHWLDSGELITAVWQLSAAHPPGEAGYVSFSKALTLIPVGSVAQRVNLGSALALVAASVLSLRVVRLLFAPLLRGHSRGTVTLTVLMAGVLPFLSYALWIQGVRAEVYALQLCLSLGLLWSLLTSGVLGGELGFPGGRTHTREAPTNSSVRVDVRWLGVAGLLGGLNLTVHPLLAGLVGLPLLLLSLLPVGEGLRRWSGRGLLLAFLGGMLGLSAQLLLPVRAWVQPLQGWGDARSWQGLWDVLLARTFQRNFSPLTLELVAHNLRSWAEAMASVAGPAFLLGASMSWLHLLWGRETRRLGLLLGGLVWFNLGSMLFQNKVFTDNPDLHGYLAVGLLSLWWLLLVGLLRLSLWASAWLRWAVPLGVGVAPLALLLPAWLLVWPALDRSEDTHARALGLAGLRGLSGGAGLVVSGNSTTFVLTYLQAVEGRRPDVTLLPRALLTHPWYRARLSLPEPWLRQVSQSVVGLAIPASLSVWRVELRPPDLPRAAELCPVPSPGWGFFELGRCEGLSASVSSGASAEETAKSFLTQWPEGLLSRPGLERGPEGLAVALQLEVLELAWLRARGAHEQVVARRRWLEQQYPGVRLSLSEGGTE
ncbi:MAG: protein O-mannosyl-transferase family [Myxococcota bacterium]